MKTANNNTNPNTASQVTQSWAHTVSDYLLQRRLQNQRAYETAFAGESSVAGASIESEQHAEQKHAWLFKALFIALAQQLEEGHTVLTLSTDDSNKSAILYAWQQHLVMILLSPLTEYIDQALLTVVEHTAQNEEGNTTTENSLSNNDPIPLLIAQWPQVVMQLALPREDHKILTERYKLGRKLYEYFQSSNGLTNSIENSLSKFINLISENELFTTAISKESAPIRYQTLYNENSLSITLWIQRTWQAEHTLAQRIQKISSYQIKPLPIAINPDLNSEQQAAIEMANNSAFSIITGGPGTGKTYTVAQLVIALKDTQHQDKLPKRAAKDKSASLALSAPTGKAAQRMQESLQAALDAAGVSMQLQEAKTIHRLLGIGQSGRPRYHTDNPLSEDIVIVDEASMLGVELANHLVSAIKPGARLILLGDANQLAAVDAGAVLADLCRIPMLQTMHKELTESRRFRSDSGIGKLAVQINSAKTNMPSIWQLLAEDEALAFQSVRSRVDVIDSNISGGNNEDSANITNNQNINSLSSYKIFKNLSNNYQNYVNKIKNSLQKSQLAKSVPKIDYETFVSELLTTLNQFRILTAGHHGRWGDHALNDYLSDWHINQLKLPVSNSPWFHGRPVMVLQNSYELGLFNGDIGICLQTEQGLEVFFENKQQGIAVNLLNDEMIATAYAMTIHKSQGSEFEHVAITFDDSNMRLLSKELIYTAVTRAKKQVSIYSTPTAFARAISTPTERQTGLALQFAEG
jgi:exodeoxyribonuclease V alpha subunit